MHRNAYKQTKFAIKKQYTKAYTIAVKFVLTDSSGCFDPVDIIKNAKNKIETKKLWPLKVQLPICNYKKYLFIAERSFLFFLSLLFIPCLHGHGAPQSVGRLCLL